MTLLAHRPTSVSPARKHRLSSHPLSWSTTKGVPFLNRYTDITVALDMLQERRLTLMSPLRWEDRNDAFAMERYQQTEGHTCVLAICFCQSREMYHHWRVFAHGSSGVCIEFDKQALLNSVDQTKGFTHGPVVYRRIKTLRLSPQLPQRWPFTKRTAFADEREYRIIYRGRGRKIEALHHSIQPQWVRRITLSPWMPAPLLSSVTSVIHSIQGFARLRVARSTLLNNEDWKAALDGG